MNKHGKRIARIEAQRGMNEQSMLEALSDEDLDALILTIDFEIAEHPETPKDVRLFHMQRIDGKTRPVLSAAAAACRRRQITEIYETDEELTRRIMSLDAEIKSLRGEHVPLTAAPATSAVKLHVFANGAYGSHHLLLSGPLVKADDRFDNIAEWMTPRKSQPT